jgi:XTP/dITP diphosphohydrolase
MTVGNIPLNLLSIHRIKPGEELKLPALFLDIQNAQELDGVLNYCSPTQSLTLFNSQTRFFAGEKSQLSHLEFTYPLHAYMVDPVGESCRQLVDIVAQLRHPQTGCPWDLAQTPTSLAPYVLEEAYEVVHALGTGQPAAIQEELGDLLLQVVLQSQIGQEMGDFSWVEVARGISEKLVRRHPHVFGELVCEDVAVVRQNWEAIKQQEQGYSLTEKLDNYMATFPTLIAAGKIYQKLQINDPDNLDFAHDSQTLHEQLHTCLTQPSSENLGRLLFLLVAWGTAHHLDPNLALSEMNCSVVKHHNLRASL